jgi:hypothetical protein
VVGDGSGGAFVAWDDSHPSTLSDVYAQHIMADGSRAAGWASAGLPVADAPNNQRVGGGTALISTIVSDGSGGAVVAWSDWELSSAADVVAQRITGAGVVGPTSCAGCDAIVSLTPNPAAGRLRIELKSPDDGSSAVLRLYDLAGRLRREMKFSGLPPFGSSELELDLTGLPAGVYFLRYTGGGSSPIAGRRQVTIVR